MNDLVPLFSAAGGLGGVAALLIAVLRWVSQDRKEALKANEQLLMRLKAANEREAAIQADIDKLRAEKRAAEDALIQDKRVLEGEKFQLQQQVISLQIQLGATGGTS